jgi:hypothetical protein
LSTVEISGDWYTFMYGQAESIDLTTGVTRFSPTAVMFPSLGLEGITGELLLGRPADLTEARPSGELGRELRVLAAHEKLIDMLRNGDVDGIIRLTHPKTQVGVRDYVNETRTVTEIHDVGAARAYLTSYYERFTVRSIEPIDRYVGDYFSFAELRWTVDDSRTGQTLQYHTAEMTDIDDHGIYRARIGMGTDPKVL